MALNESDPQRGGWTGGGYLDDNTVDRDGIVTFLILLALFLIFHFLSPDPAEITRMAMPTAGSATPLAP